jgi:hydroxymethylglutaryl-CoA synthase
MSENKVGILGIEVYFPSTFVAQEDLEKANGVSSGKYTIGLGQQAMAFTGDHEDVNSIALTVVQSLLEKYEIDPNQVGRLEVGSETLVDKSKSTKTVLMSLFEPYGNNDIEGATVVNACYGGTAALINALTWVDSSGWDGRFAIVVAADIAVYSEGPARPTGGCGSVALLVGRNAPLVVDLKSRSTFATHNWDFFKPDMNSEYPVVNGTASQTCYLHSVDDCYRRLVSKAKLNCSKNIQVSNTDYFVFHSPYNKLVQKGFSRLIFQDMCLGLIDSSLIQKWKDIPLQRTYDDKELETVLKQLSNDEYKKKVEICCKLSKQVGNTYTASVYLNLANLVYSLGDQLGGKSVLVFSYGSGSVATMLSIVAEGDCKNNMFSLSKMQRALNLSSRLQCREKLCPRELNIALRTREDSIGVIPYEPKCDIAKLFPGTFYLKGVTKNFERIYARKPLSSSQKIGGGILRNESIENEDFQVGMDLEDSSKTIERANASTKNEKVISPVATSAKQTIVRNETFVWPSGKTTVKVVVTGVSAALPGRDHEVLPTGVDNIERIISGESFITPIPDDIKDDMLQKNIFETIKTSDGTLAKVPIKTYERSINISASLGRFSLSSYGVSASIVSTMDKAVQVAIAAGLEALKDAGIVTGVGTGTSGWELPASMQNSTGIVYATSFPALDTAVEEVTKYFKSKAIDQFEVNQVFRVFKEKLTARGVNITEELQESMNQIEQLVDAYSSEQSISSPYEFDRKFLFRVLVLGNAQLAQIIKAKGPNLQSNAACAGK